MSLYFYRWTKLAIVSGLVGILMGCAMILAKYWLLVRLIMVVQAYL